MKLEFRIQITVNRSLAPALLTRARTYLGVAQDHKAILGPGEGHIKSARVAQETNALYAAQTTSDCASLSF